MGRLVRDHLPDIAIGERRRDQLLDVVRLEAELLTGAATPLVAKLLSKAMRIFSNCD